MESKEVTIKIVCDVSRAVEQLEVLVKLFENFTANIIQAICELEAKP
jgi:hypothetical protein